MDMEKYYIYFEGLERSGNVFFSHCIGTSLGCKVISPRKHQVFVLEEYQKDAPFVVPLRDALDSMVSSRIFRKYQYEQRLGDNYTIENTLPENIVDRYKSWVNYLIDHDDFFIAPFHEFTKDHDAVIDVMLKVYPQLVRIDRVSAENIINQIKENNMDVDHPYLGNFPREDASEKQEVKDLFLANYSDEIDSIQRKIDILYQRYYAISSV